MIDDVDGGTVGLGARRLTARSRRLGGRPHWRRPGRDDSIDRPGSHLARGVVDSEQSVGCSGKNGVSPMGTVGNVSGSQHRVFRTWPGRLIDEGTASNNTRNGVWGSTGNSGGTSLDRTTVSTTAMAMAEMVLTSKARGCSTDRAGTRAALLASCGAYGVRAGSSTRPLSVLPRGAGARGNKQVSSCS